MSRANRTFVSGIMSLLICAVPATAQAPASAPDTALAKATPEQARAFVVSMIEQYSFQTCD